MTEKKKPEAKKPAVTQRFSDVAKDLGIEVKALIALVDEFVLARPDFKDYVYTEGKKPAASSNFGKTYREEFLAFAADKLPKKPEPAPEPVVEAPKAPEPVKPPVAPVASVAKASSPLPVSMPPRPMITPTAKPPASPAIPRPTITPTTGKADLPPIVISNAPPPVPSRPANVPPVARPPLAPIVNRPAATGSQAAPGSKGAITVRPPIVVRDFAIALNLKPFQVIGNLMELNKVVSVSSVIEEADARTVAERHGFTLEIRHRGEGAQPVKKIEKPVEDDPALMTGRPPVVCVLGHVDHGKTTLLDFFRKTNVVSGEAGGITQHIGAYSVAYQGEKAEYKGKTVTFLDTPGHAAFAKMRERGASVTDIAVLVVAADDGFMPQTEEALKFAQKHASAIVAAINKVDSKGANIDRVKQQMQQRSITPEDWGGETITSPVSALKGTGMTELLESILLQAEVLDLKANAKCPAQGVVIESQMETGRGPTATVIVQKGTLKPGDSFVCGETWCKVRALVDERGNRMPSATPGAPALILGWDAVPAPGTKFKTVKNDREAREIAEEAALAARKAAEAAQQAPNTGARPGMSDLERLMAALVQDKEKVLRVLLKADVNGTLEALEGCLVEIKSSKVRLEVVGGSVGPVTQGDVAMAEASKALIVAFDTKLETGVQPQLKRTGVRLLTHDIIYELITLVKEAMTELLDPEVRENKLGAAEVRAVFPLGKEHKVAGCMVTEGLIRRAAKARVVRAGKIIHHGPVETLRRFKDDASEVKAGFECGIKLGGYDEYQPGDIIEAIEMLQTRPSL
ncbi:MAG: translation initiation factor IF-2 [Opitutia bacterium]|nr:translation initiation factor IF-2 [Opitutales bacterium]PHX80031.1 MAG: translation initiation factor IF-2 [Opitutae bacterium]